MAYRSCREVERVPVAIAPTLPIDIAATVCLPLVRRIGWWKRQVIAFRDPQRCQQTVCDGATEAVVDSCRVRRSKMHRECQVGCEYVSDAVESVIEDKCVLVNEGGGAGGLRIEVSWTRHVPALSVPRSFLPPPNECSRVECRRSFHRGVVETRDNLLLHDVGRERETHGVVLRSMVGPVLSSYSHPRFSAEIIQLRVRDDDRHRVLHIERLPVWALILSDICRIGMLFVVKLSLQPTARVCGCVWSLQEKQSEDEVSARRTPASHVLAYMGIRDLDLPSF